MKAEAENNSMEQDELLHAPALKSLRNTAFFEMPEGYSEKLDADLDRLIRENEKGRKVISISAGRKAVFITSIAAALTAVLFVFRANEPVQTDFINQTNSITTEDLIASGYDYTLDEHILTESLNNESDLETMFSDPGSDNIEDYLFNTTDQHTLISYY